MIVTEFPLAESIATSEIWVSALLTSLDILSWIFRTGFRVKSKFVPVSASGTGKTFILFKCSCLDITLQIPSSDKFREHFGWKPEKDLTHICDDLLDYWRKYYD